MAVISASRERAAAALQDIFSSPFLQALTEGARLELVRILLAQGPLDVAALARQVPQERSVVSRHLKILVEAGIVSVEQRGRFRVYGLDGTTLVSELEQLVDRLRTLVPACCPPELQSRAAVSAPRRVVRRAR